MTENTGNKYEEYNGKLLDLLPKLRSEGRQLISIAGVMQGRLEGISSLEATVDTCDAIAIHPTGKRKLVLSSAFLLNLTPASNLLFGALPLTEKEYLNLPGYEFTEEEFKGFGHPREYPSGVATNPLWKAVVLDHNLLKKYAEYARRVYSSLKAHDAPSTYMGVYPGSIQRETTVGRKGMPVLIPLSLQDVTHRSYLSPSPILDNAMDYVLVSSETRRVAPTSLPWSGTSGELITKL